MPQAWHRRQALLIGAQLPENPADARLVLEALSELLDTFMAEVPIKEHPRAKNVLPFVSG